MAAGENPEFIQKMESAVKELLARGGDREWTSPRSANKILRRIRDAARIPDPYREFKTLEMDQAGRIFARVEAQLPQDLRGRVHTAVAGNSSIALRKDSEVT